MDDLLKQLDQWHRDDEFQKIIDCLEELSKTRPLDYKLTGLLARAYNNRASYGDRERLGKAIGLLRSVAKEGKDDPIWHYRLGYAYFYMDQMEEALACFRRALELNPADEDAANFVRRCQKSLRIQNNDPIPAALNREEAAPPALNGARPVGKEEKGSSGEKNDTFGQREAKNSTPEAPTPCEAPEMYSREDWDAVEAHLTEYFGPCDQVFHELVSPDIHVDIYIMAPTPDRNYYTLSTFGMGAHRMNVPPELADRKLERAEIIVTLPPDWKINDPDEKWYWPIRWLKILARLPIEENSWLGWGHTVSNPDDAPFADNTKLCGVVLMEPSAFPEEAVCCPLPGGEEVNFYQMIPLYFDEMQFKLGHDAETLLSRFPMDALEVVDIARPSVCGDRPEKALAIPREELKHLYDGEGPQGCIATDRIVVDGCPVGYCYRVEPDPGDGDWDSGWRFTAGDESTAYMDDPDRSAVYALNTICNYDPDIIPLLDSEPGTAWSRGEDGVFRPELLE